MLTYKEFRNLSDEEKGIRYKELSNEDKLLARTSDIIKPIILEENAIPPEDSDEWYEQAKKEMDERINKLKEMRKSREKLEDKQ